MTTHPNWIMTLGFLLLVPGCVLAKSVGDDPESVDTDTEASTSDAGADTDSGTSQGPGNVSATSQGPGSATSTTSGANPSASGISATQGTSGGDPEACGIEEVPDGFPGYIYSFDCGTCRYDFVVPLPLDNINATNECLCAAPGCGEPQGEDGEAGGEPGASEIPYAGVCDVEILPNEGPGDYQASCLCEICNVDFVDIDPASGDNIFDDPDTCNCLCLEAGCGYSNGGGAGEVGGLDTGTASDTDGGTTTSSG